MLVVSFFRASLENNLVITSDLLGSVYRYFTHSTEITSLSLGLCYKSRHLKRKVPRWVMSNYHYLYMVFIARVDHINTKSMFIDKLCHLTHVRLLMIQRLPLPNIWITRAHFAKYLYKGIPPKDKYFCGCRLENDREWMKIKGNEVWI